jgi:hypothetical protein
MSLIVANALIVCAFLSTLKLTGAVLAGAYFVLPGWVAARVTMPAPVNVTVLPLTVAGPERTLSETG